MNTCLWELGVLTEVCSRLLEIFTDIYINTYSVPSCIVKLLLRKAPYMKLVKYQLYFL